jgi:hypothetical protein
MAVPLDRDALLTRAQLSAALGELGIPVAPTTLSTKAVRGGGPEYLKFGPHVLYRWGTAYDWAMARLTPRASTSEDVA